MFLPLSSLILLLLGHALAWWLWRRFTVTEVAENARLITANGATDDLRAGFHQRRTWIRFWAWIGLSVGASLLGLYTSYWVFLLSFAAIGTALATYFARYFTPMLNVAMKLDYKPEFYASPDSASWPDAAIWKRLRAAGPLADARLQQAQANAALRILLTTTWHAGLAAYALLLAGAGALLFLK